MAKILIVDDDPTIGLMVKDILEFNGHDVMVTQEPAEARDKILEHDAELVILDKLISGVDGTDVCAELKKDEEVRDVPILMMSALHNVGEVCKNAGATDFLAKPFDMDTLVDRVALLIKHSQNT